MKILEINKFHNARRGADKHFLHLIELLKSGGDDVAVFSMRQQGDAASEWEPFFLSPVGYTDRFTLWQKIKGVGRMFYSFEAHRKIKRLLDAFQPDIVHVHNIYHQMDPTILFAIKKRGIPIVMTVHDFKIINPNHSMVLDGKAYGRCRQGAYYQCVLDRCVKNSYGKSFIAMLEAYWHRLLGTYRTVDLFIAPSFFVKDQLVEWGIPTDAITVIPHCTGHGNLSGGISQTSADDARAPYALYAGNISAHKGVETLLRIFERQTKLKLYLAGEIEQGLKIPENAQIAYLGVLPPEQIARSMAGARCVVSATRLPETFGLIALEALASGVGFVGFDTGAFFEIITDKRQGILVRTEEELRATIDKVASGEIVFDRQALLARAAEFTADAYRQRIRGLFANLVTGRKRGRQN